MADGIKARIGTVWKDLTPSIKVGAAWKTPDAVHIKVGGVWKQVWTGVTVTVSGETISAFAFSSTATAGVYFYTSGTYQGDVRKRVNGAYTLIDNTTDWIRPETEAPGTYRIRYSGMTGDTGFVTNSITATYDGIINGDYIYIIDNSPAFGGNSVTFTIEIDDGTTLQDSGVYTITADREDF